MAGKGEQTGGREELERNRKTRRTEAISGLSPELGCTRGSDGTRRNLGRPPRPGEGPVAFLNHGAIRPGLAPLRRSNY